MKAINYCIALIGLSWAMAQPPVDKTIERTDSQPADVTQSAAQSYEKQKTGDHKRPSKSSKKGKSSKRKHGKKNKEGIKTQG